MVQKEGLVGRNWSYMIVQRFPKGWWLEANGSGYSKPIYQGVLELSWDTTICRLNECTSLYCLFPLPCLSIQICFPRVFISNGIIAVVDMILNLTWYIHLYPEHLATAFFERVNATTEVSHSCSVMCSWFRIFLIVLPCAPPIPAFSPPRQTCRPGTHWAILHHDLFIQSCLFEN